MNELLVKQGGYALKSVGVQRISRCDISATIQYVSLLSGIPLVDMIPLGSTGKTHTSGDIDVAIDINKYDRIEVHNNMERLLGSDKCKYNPGTKVGSYAIPIKGNPELGLVQVDLMFVPNVKWAEFTYYSPGDQSSYKGAIRRMLLQSVASTIDEEGTDIFVYDPVTNDLMVRIGRTMDMNLGLKRIFQMRPMKKRGGGYLSTIKTVPVTDIRSAYPSLIFNDIDRTIYDPVQALRIMFGMDIAPSSVETAEQIISLIQTVLPSDRQQMIFKRAAAKMAEVSDQMNIPNLG
jgi:hypothetical protein